MVTLKLQTVRTMDVTADAGYEYKRQNTVEQDLAFTVVRESVHGSPLVAPVKPAEYSTLGKEIDLLAEERTRADL